MLPPSSLAIVSVHAMCSIWHVAFLQWSLGDFRCGGDPFVGHGSVGQRKTYVFPGGHLILLHSAVAGSYRSLCGATAHLNLVARSF